MPVHPDHARQGNRTFGSSSEMMRQVVRHAPELHSGVGFSAGTTSDGEPVSRKLYHFPVEHAKYGLKGRVLSFRGHGLRGRGGSRSPATLPWMKKAGGRNWTRPGEDAEAAWPRHFQEELPKCMPRGTLLSAGSIGDETRQ